VFQEIYWAEIFGKILHGFKPCELKNRNDFSSWILFSYSQAFLFFNKKYCIELYSILFKKIFTNILIIGFSPKCEL